jgi:hypothetical protein
VILLYGWLGPHGDLSALDREGGFSVESGKNRVAAHDAGGVVNEVPVDLWKRAVRRFAPLRAAKLLMFGTQASQVSVDQESRAIG